MRSMARVLVLVLLATSLATPLLSDEVKPPASPSVVSIPLDVYNSLRKAEDNASATVVDTMTIAGTFHDRTLTITFAGRSVGAHTAVEVIHNATDVTLSGCAGDALITRGGKGVFELIALSGSFTLKCDARSSGSDRLQMTVQPSVLSVRSAVSDGELVAADEDDQGARAFTLVRQVVGTGETLATTATGRYLVTLLPDTSRFRYVIQVHNPNRSTSPLPLRLVSNEHLQQIDSSAPYEIKDGSYVFAMPPGDSAITLSGELAGTSFAPPVAASLQYAVIESHPLLRPLVQGSPKRVATSETGISTEYRGAVAFEIGARERITWSVTRLQALRAISYAVKNATHRFFIPANGPILGESEFQLDNQGAPELVLPPKPEPTFVSLGNEPVLMTKNAKGELTIPLSAGIQKVTVQHRQATPHWGVLMTRLDVPRIPVPATYSNVILQYPEHWLPLWQSFATQATLWRPDEGMLLGFLLLALWLERVLAFLELALSRRIAAALLLAFASLLIPTVAWITVLAAIFVTIVGFASNRTKWSPVRMGVTILAVFITALVWLAVNNLTHAINRKAVSSYDSVQRAEQANGVADTATDTATSSVTTTAASSVTKGNEQVARGYMAFDAQNLPAKFELPSGERSSSFAEQMLAADRPQSVTIVLLSMTLVTWLAAALAAGAAWLLWRERATIKATLRARMAAAASTVAPTVAPA